MFLLIVFVLVGNFDVYAEQVTSVKECIENPEKCNEENKKSIENGSDESVSEESNKVGLDVWDFIKMVFATLFVVGLLYFMLKFINKRNKVYSQTQFIQNIGGTSLGGNRSVQMIKIGDRILIVGVGENIQLLKEIENDEEVRQILTTYNKRIEQLMGPSDIVTKVLKRARTDQSMDNSKEESAFSSILKTQLDEISLGRKKLYEDIEKKGSEKQ